MSSSHPLLQNDNAENTQSANANSPPSFAIDRFMESKGGSLLSFSPIVLLIVLSCQHELAAAISALAVTVILVCIDYHRSHYRVDVPFPNFLKTIELFAFVAITICCALDIGFSPKLFGPVILTSLSVGMLSSIVVGWPFTLQMSRHRVTEEIAASAAFMRFNIIISLYWFIVLAIMCGCSWISYVLQPGCDHNAVEAQVIGGVPLVLPLVASAFMPRLIAWLRSRNPTSAQPVRNEGLDEPIIMTSEHT